MWGIPRKNVYSRLPKKSGGQKGFAGSVAATEAEDKERLLAVNQDVNTSTSVSSKRERPPCVGVDTMEGSDASHDKRYRADTFRLALVADTEVVEQHAQRRNPELQSRTDAAIPARVADECSRVLEQELSTEEEETYVDPAQEANVKELGAWRNSGVLKQFQERAVSKKIVQTKWVRTYKMMEGTKSIDTRMVAKGYQDPALKKGLVDTSGCVSLRSPHLRAISLRAVKKWKIWRLEIENAFLRAAGFNRAVFLRAPTA